MTRKLTSLLDDILGGLLNHFLFGVVGFVCCSSHAQGTGVTKQRTACEMKRKEWAKHK